MIAVTRSASATAQLAEAVGTLLEPGDVVVLSGDLGAGKTVFAGGMAHALGIGGPLVSPTFTIVREYEGRLRLAHVDVYRLSGPKELHGVGFDELLDGETVVVCEWGDRVAAALPADRLEVRLAPGDGPDERVLELVGHGTSWAARAGRLADAVRAWLAVDA